MSVHPVVKPGKWNGLSVAGYEFVLDAEYDHQENPWSGSGWLKAMVLKPGQPATFINPAQVVHMWRAP